MDAGDSGDEFNRPKDTRPPLNTTGQSSAQGQPPTRVALAEDFGMPEVDIQNDMGGEEPVLITSVCTCSYQTLITFMSNIETNHTIHVLALEGNHDRQHLAEL